MSLKYTKRAKCLNTFGAHCSSICMPNGPIFSHAEIAYCRKITCILAKLMKDCVVQHHHFDPYLENLWSKNPVEVKIFLIRVVIIIIFLLRLRSSTK